MTLSSMTPRPRKREPLAFITICLIALAGVSIAMMFYLEKAEDTRFQLPGLATLHLGWYGLGICFFILCYHLATSLRDYLAPILLSFGILILLAAFFQGQTGHGLPYLQVGMFRVNAIEACVLVLLLPFSVDIAKKEDDVTLVGLILGPPLVAMFLGSDNATFCLSLAACALAIQKYRLQPESQLRLLTILVAAALAAIPIIKGVWIHTPSSVSQVIRDTSGMFLLYDVTQGANGHAEFILSHIIEHFGLILGILVVALLTILIRQLRELAHRALSQKTQCVTLALSAYITGQVVFNILVVFGIAVNPASGVALPFVSYGGSQLILELGILGIVFGWNANDVIF